MTPEQAWACVKNELYEKYNVPRSVVDLAELVSARRTNGQYEIVLAANRQHFRQVDGLHQSIVVEFSKALMIPETRNCLVTIQPDGDELPAGDLRATWEAVLARLQSEMPRASFDTWVRDTQIVAFEGGVLTISVRNAYARDWIADRLSNTILRLASAETGQAVDNLSAVVGSELAQESDDATDLADAQDAEEKGSLSIEPVVSSSYRELVQPERIVMLPGYSLRLLAQGDMTAKEMSLWVGFRQAVYSRWKKKQGTVKNIPYWEAARFAMMSRASYFRELKNRIELQGREYLAGGMVEVIPNTADGLTGDARFDNANRYRVHMTPRLTRRDCAAIGAALTDRVCTASTHEEGCQLAVQALEDLATRNPADYLDAFTGEPWATWPRSIHEIVRHVLGWQGDLPEDLHQAGEKLYEHLISAFGQVSITHYFLRVVAPTLKLTHPQAWAIITLRDRCWYDYEQGIQHNFAIVPGGLNTLARWVGVTRKALDGWVHQPVFSAFVHETDLSQLELPESWREKNVAIFLVSLLEPELGDEEGSEKVRLGIGKSETRSWKKRDSGSEKVRLALEKVRLGIGKSETRLNNLIKPLLNPYKPQLTLPTTARDNHARRAGSGSLAYWDFDFLMANNSVGNGGAKTLLKTQKEMGRDIAALSRGFVSWLLYGYSRSGLGLTNPVSNAIARLRENIYAGAGGDYDRLAALRPAQLKALFDADFAGQLDPEQSLEADLYAYQFSELEPEPKRDLYRRLFGE